ncbi:nodulation efficiency protein D family protein [Hyphomonas adhaerens MHS-3]|uniref:Nodulation efficiency protein D family protein n=1 Tax=Hyphomonas adhaerens MHS-3 TaxID=1280949 RepID=A0A069E9R5_9PROT|nr:NfeD family protein [Hyphomonas adhaerens]KCZ86341.1 nodulation efficiency protein D family protein [Hyphomonas adhaerens MHS-3]
MLEELFTHLTVWHWLALGLILFGIEMMTGTFDLLMISIAAWITAVFAWLAPDSLATWQGQVLFFGAAAVALFVFGRTILSGMRKSTPEHPTLNKRMESLIGQRGVAASDFTNAGQGRVKIGDTVWGAEVVDGSEIIHNGDVVVVEGARMNTALVRKSA